MDSDHLGATLLRSKLSNQYIIYGPVDPEIITWSQSTSNVNSVWVKSVTILDLQEQPLLTTSAEKFSDPSTRKKLAQMAKDKGTKKILANTKVEKVNSKVHVKYLYNEKKLPKLDEHYFGSTKRISVLHNKIVFKPEVASGMDQYITKSWRMRTT